MPALKVHVRPPHRHKGLMILCAVYGALCGGAFFAFIIAIEGTMAIPMRFVVIVITCMFLTPGLLGALYLSRVCQHKGWVYAGGQITSSSYLAAIMVSAVLFEGPPSTGTPWEYLIMLAVIAGGGVVGGLINLLFRGIQFNHISRLVEQDGTLCINCGYCVAHSPWDRCPECGTPKDAPIRKLGIIYAFAELLARHSGKMKYAFCILFVLAAGTFLRHEIPVWRFTSRFETDDSVVQQSFHRPGGRNQEFYGSALDISRPIENDAQGRVLIIQHYRRSYFGDPRLQVRVGQVVSMPGGGTRIFRYVQDGVPRVLCELDERQTDYAMDYGIPSSLVTALIEAADEAGWTAKGPNFIAEPDVVVSADGHFPELEKGQR